MKSIILFSFSSIIVTSSGFSQQASYFDPAQAYNKLLMEKGKGAYMQISNYKVIGTPYLFGERNMGDIHSATELAVDIPLSYNTYNQDIEFFTSPGSKEPLIKEPGTLDSFIINKNLALTGITEDLIFIYGPLIGSKEKAYYQVVIKGPKVNLYKKYSSELGIVSTNYIQAGLRQFDLLVDYYYTDSTNTGLKKLKTNTKQLVKEFAAVKDLSSLIDPEALVVSKELELARLFQEMNK